MTEHPHTTEGDTECSCNPLRLTVAGDGSISRIAGGPLDEPIDTGAAPRAEGPAIEVECSECRGWPPSVHAPKCSRYGVDPERTTLGICWHGVVATDPCSICDGGADQ